METAMNKISDIGKIGVIMGGVSSERNISLKSGNAVLIALLQENLQVVPIDLKTDNPEEVEQVIYDSKIDFAFISLHGYFGEDGRIQFILDQLGIPYTGSSSQASRVAMDKVAAKKVFESQGLKTPKYLAIKSLNDFIKGSLNFPLVVKPASNGSSFGLSLIDSIFELENAFEEAKKFDKVVLLEEFIKGRELTVGILGDQALPVIEICTKRKFFDYEAKYQKGFTEYIVPAQIAEDLAREAQKVAITAHQALGCFAFSRVDIILKERDIFILELNSIPGMTETSLLPKAARYSGLNFNQLCIKLIELSLRKERILDGVEKK